MATHPECTYSTSCMSHAEGDSVYEDNYLLLLLGWATAGHSSPPPPLFKKKKKKKKQTNRVKCILESEGKRKKKKKKDSQILITGIHLQINLHAITYAVVLQCKHVLKGSFTLTLQQDLVGLAPDTGSDHDFEFADAVGCEARDCGLGAQAVVHVDDYHFFSWLGTAEGGGRGGGEFCAGLVGGQ